MKVAVAVITDEFNRILITRRSPNVSHGGFWEFPGGKLNKDELAEDALVREIKEEVGLDVVSYEYMGEVSYQYNNKDIELLIYHVNKFSGNASCKEGQLDLRWELIDNFYNFQFPAANIKIIELIKEAGVVQVEIIA